MFDLAGLALTPREECQLQHVAAGGIILFSRNYENPEQLERLVGTIRRIRPQILIAVDHEGGRVQRFREGFTRLPAAAVYRRAPSDAGLLSVDAAEAAGWLMAAELRSFDIDFSFAPVLDVDNHVSQVIGDRAFSETPDQVTQLAGAFLRGMRRAGMAGVGKHFPGHGAVREDSHESLPIDERSLADIERRDLVPFRALIDAGLEGIMPAHVLYPACDEHPAGFSPFWIGDVLRQRLKFRGVVFSDDLSMGGAGFAGDVAARARAALSAGCDMVLVCNSPTHVDDVLDAVQRDFAPTTPNRLLMMRGRSRIDRHALPTDTAWQEASAAVQRLTDET